MNLYLKQKLFSIGDKYKFTDLEQKVIYEAKKSVLSLTKIYMYDATGKELFLIKKKLIAFMPKYTVFNDGKEVLFIKRKFGIRPKFEMVDAGGAIYLLQGDFLAHDFNISRDGKYIGSIKKKYFSFGDAYELNIDDNYEPALFCSIALAIDNCIHNENKQHH